MSGEHIIADWISRQFPDVLELGGHSQDQSRIRTFFKIEPGDEPKSADDFQHKSWREQTSVAQRKLRRVCVKCNSGWMSDLQNAAIEPLSELISGIWHDLNYRKSVVLAQWMMMTFCNIDCSYPDTSSTNAEERSKFLNDIYHDLPRNWYFYIGRISGGPPITYSKRAFLSVRDTLVMDHQLHEDLNERKYTGHAITVVLKQLIMHTVAIPADDPPIEPRIMLDYGISLGLFLLQPWAGDGLDWRRAPFLTSADLPRVINEFAALRIVAAEHVALGLKAK